MRIFRHIMPVFLAIYFKSTQFADCCTKKVCLILCFASFLQKASTVTREHLFCRKQKSRIVGRPELLEGIGIPIPSNNSGRPTILDFCFRQKRCSRVTVDAFCKNEAKHRIKHTFLVQQSANWVLLKYIARNTGIIWRKMRI